MTTNRILVAGGAGFIGSHLCDYLINKGHWVVCVDNFITGRIGNIGHLLNHPRFTMLEYDVCDLNHTRKPRRILPQIDVIYHLASIASPKLYIEYPLETIRVNTVGTECLLEVARAFGATLLYASTSEVYGDPKEHPQSESYWGNVNPIGERAVYDESKRLGETIVATYKKKKVVKTKIVRLFNTYGPCMHPNDGRVVPAFINQALDGNHLTVYGTGEQTRSFCYVSDMIEALVKMMDSTRSGPMNLGNPNEYYSVKEVAELVLKLVKTRSEIRHVKHLTADDPQVRQPDISKAQKELKWQPVVMFEEGLKKTIRYYQDGRQR